MQKLFQRYYFWYLNLYQTLLYNLQKHQKIFCLMDERCLQMKLFFEIRILRTKLHSNRSMRQKKLSSKAALTLQIWKDMFRSYRKDFFFDKFKLNTFILLCCVKFHINLNKITHFKPLYSESFVLGAWPWIFFGLTFHRDHFGICQEYTWGRYGTVRSRSRAKNETFTVLDSKKKNFF